MSDKEDKKISGLPAATSIAAADVVEIDTGSASNKATFTIIASWLASLTQTLTNKTIDADNNTVSNLAHGAEVDNPSSGVHGVTGSVVGTTDTQTLTNKTLTSAVLDTGVSGTAVLDEDDLASNSDTQVATQQSVKAYVDNKKLDDLAAPDDNTDLDASTTAHGLCPKLNNDSTYYLDGTGAWSVPAGGGSSDKISEGDSSVEVIDAGTGTVEVKVDTTKRADITASGLALENGTRIDEFSTDTSLGGDSDTAVPTEKAVKAYVDDSVEIKGDGTAGRVLRQMQVWISDGTAANSIKVETVNVWNGDTIAAEDNLTKGGSTTSFSLSSDGSTLTIKNSAITGNGVANLVGAVFYNASGTDVLSRGYYSSGLAYVFYTAPTGGIFDLTTLTGATQLQVVSVYLTDA